MPDFISSEIDSLNRIRRALEEAPAGTFVIAGGWAARLLRRHPLARTLDFDALVTQDIDIAAPNERGRARGRVGEKLEREGFKPQFGYEDHPPVTLYALEGGLDLEFIAPWVPRRPGRNSTTLAVYGAIAQTARHVEILLVEPCELEVLRVGKLTVASPAPYLVQKALSMWSRRTISKKGKDALYLWEVISLFSEGSRLRNEVKEMARRIPLVRSQKKALIDARARLGDPDDSVIREAAEQAKATGRGVDAAALALALRTGFAELF